MRTAHDSLCQKLADFNMPHVKPEDCRICPKIEIIRKDEAAKRDTAIAERDLARSVAVGLESECARLSNLLAAVGGVLALQHTRPEVTP